MGPICGKFDIIGMDTGTMVSYYRFVSALELGCVFTARQHSLLCRAHVIAIVNPSVRLLHAGTVSKQLISYTVMGSSLEDSPGPKMASKI